MLSKVTRERRGRRSHERGGGGGHTREEGEEVKRERRGRIDTPNCKQSHFDAPHNKYFVLLITRGCQVISLVLNDYENISTAYVGDH